MRGKHSLRKLIWWSAETREQLWRYIARERSKIDGAAPHPAGAARRSRTNIFLSTRKRQLEYSGFRIIFNRLLVKAQRHFAASTPIPDALEISLPNITPHTIRHLHTMFRVRKVRELFSSPAKRERALEALVDDLGWRSSEMLKT